MDYSFASYAFVTRWKDMEYEYAKKFRPDYKRHDRDSGYFMEAKFDFYWDVLEPALQSYIHLIDDPNFVTHLSADTIYAFKRYGHAFPKLMKDVRASRS